MSKPFKIIAVTVVVKAAAVYSAAKSAFQAPILFSTAFQ